MACVVLLAALVTAEVKGGEILYVDASSGGGDGSSWAAAFSDLQDALATAQAGDEVWVAAGQYVPSATGDATASFYLANGVALYGGFSGNETYRWQRDWSANETILSGDVGGDDEVGSGPFWYTNWNIHTPNCGHVVVGSGTDASAVLDGFTIADGHTGPAGTPAGSPLMVGSGIYLVGGSPTIRHCTFTHCLAAFASGGAVYCMDASPTITQCRFVENYTHLGNGAGIFTYGASAPVIEDCFFQYNTVVASVDASGAGFAHWTSTDITVRRCDFDGNVAKSFYSVGNAIGYGGGLWNWNGHMTVEDCTFLNNTATMGGGFMSWGPATLVNCLFAENRAVPQPNDPLPELGGEGAAIAVQSAQADVVTLLNCTILNNHGKKHAVASGWNSALDIRNTIIWGNTATSPDVANSWRTHLAGSFDLTYSCVALIFDPPEPGEDPFDPADLPGVIDDDPILIDPAGDDYRLAAASPCIEAGDPVGAPPITHDLAGHPRVLCGAVDLGAYEFGVGDYDCNRGVDLTDYTNWLACVTGPGGGPYAGACLAFDTDNDGDVDFRDFAEFQRVFAEF